MKKRKLILLPLFCLVLAGCGNVEPVIPVVKDPTLSETAKSIQVDDSFVLSIKDAPTGKTPVWSKEGNAISLVSSDDNLSATITGIEAGEATVKVSGLLATDLTCTVTVTAKPVDRDPLTAPVLEVNAAKNGLTWAAIEDAVGYKITVNSGEPTTVTEPGYLFNEQPGEYTVAVVAKADEEAYDSQAATFAYQTKATVVGALSQDDDKVLIASLEGVGVEMKIGEGEFARLEEGQMEITALENGTYTFHAIGGYDEANRILYVDGAESTKTIEVTLRNPIATPVLEVNAAKNGLTWEAVEGAEGYIIKVNDGAEEVVTEPGYAFAQEAGQYTVKVIAKADLAKYNSGAAEFSYEVKNTALGELTLANGVITWASLVGMGVECKVGNGEFAPVTGESVAVEEYGMYTLHAVPGYDEANKILYVEAEASINQRQVLAAPDRVVVEDGSAEDNNELAEGYTIQKYTDANGWVASGCSVALNNVANADFTEGNCVRFHYWANWTQFRFVKQIQLLKGYNNLFVTIKGDTFATVKIRLVVTQDIVIGDVNIKGVYAQISLGENLPETWTKHVISMNDANWQVNFGGNNYPAATIAAQLGAQSLGDLLPYFDSFQFLVKAGTGDGPEKNIYMDDVMFTNDGLESSQTVLAQAARLRDAYVMNTTAIHGQINVHEGGESATAKIRMGGNKSEMDVALQLNKAESKLVVISENEGADFVLNLETADGGATWTYVSATGTLAPYMAEARFGEMVVVDDFTGVSETGTGLDKANSTGANLSGLRANYYCDFYDQYSGGSGAASPIGGNNWWLMGSSDYLNYVADGCFDAGAARLKGINSSRNMRYMTGALAAAGLGQITGAPKLADAGFKTMSFMVKGDASNDVKIRLIGYYQNSVTASTQQNNRTVSADYTVAKNSGYAEYKLTLDASKTYYGFSFMVLSGSTTVYIYVDNIIMYK